MKCINPPQSKIETTAANAAAACDAEDLVTQAAVEDG
jgi:hypothetical protein